MAGAIDLTEEPPAGEPAITGGIAVTGRAGAGVPADRATTGLGGLRKIPWRESSRSKTLVKSSGRASLSSS